MREPSERALRGRLDQVGLRLLRKRNGPYIILFNNIGLALLTNLEQVERWLQSEREKRESLRDEMRAQLSAHELAEVEAELAKRPSAQPDGLKRELSILWLRLFASGPR